MGAREPLVAPGRVPSFAASQPWVAGGGLAKPVARVLACLFGLDSVHISKSVLFWKKRDKGFAFGLFNSCVHTITFECAERSVSSFQI